MHIVLGKDSKDNLTWIAHSAFIQYLIGKKLTFLKRFRIEAHLKKNSIFSCPKGKSQIIGIA